MLSWDPNIKIHIFQSRNPSCGSLHEVEQFFRWRDFSEAPSATATEPNELPPIAAGGEGIGKRIPAVVINNTMLNGHRVLYGALGALSKSGKGGRTR